MIPQSIKNDLKNLVKKAISILPPSFPAKLYSKSAKIPLARNILKTFVKSLVPEFAEIPEGKIFLDPSDMAVSGAIALGAFENYESEIFRKAIKPGMNIVDIGAQIGYYTVIFGARTGPSGKVFAFEPEKHNHSFLEKNIKENKLLNVSIINKAVSDMAGSRLLFLEQDNRGHNSFAKDTEKPGEGVVVETDTLDNMLKAFDSPKIDILKIDIEGAEPIALRGMKESIARSQNMIIITEVYPLCMERLGESPTAYLKELEAIGFKLSSIDEEKKALTPIDDIEKFVKNIPKGEFFKNIFAEKNKIK